MASKAKPPAHGTDTYSAGPYTVLANYFAITYRDNFKKTWKRYNVEVEATVAPKVAPKGFKLQQIIRQAAKRLGVDEDKYASDFKSQLIVLNPIPPQDREFTVEFANEQGRTKPYRVKLVGEADINFDDLTTFVETGKLPVKDANPYTYFSGILDACGIVLGHKARSDPGTNSLRSGRFFRFEPEPLNHSKDLSRGTDVPALLKVMRGYFQSVRPAAASAATSNSSAPFLLNANVAYGVFRNPLPLSVILAQRNDFRSSDGLKALIDLDRQLARIKIVYNIPGQQAQGSTSTKQLNKVMLGLADKNRISRGKGDDRTPRFDKGYRFGGPQQVKFLLDDRGSMSNNLKSWFNGNKSDPWITVHDYFYKQFGRKLNVSLPLIDIGTPEKPIFVPAELCKIRPGQLVASQLDSNASNDMINFACKLPLENKKLIEKSGREVLHLDGNKTLGNFGLEVARDLKKAEGRLLRAPDVIYQSKKKALQEARGGGWY
ncbi:ribonuclease H-like domain-containing protein [Apiospora arundinis]